MRLQVELRFGLRARIDTAATLSKALATLALLHNGRLSTAYSFCAAQLLYAAVILSGYLVAYVPELLGSGSGGKAQQGQPKTQPVQQLQGVGQRAQKQGQRQEPMGGHQGQVDLQQQHGQGHGKQEAHDPGQGQGQLPPGMWGMWASFSVQAAEKLLLSKASAAVIALVKDQYDQVRTKYKQQGMYMVGLYRKELAGQGVLCCCLAPLAKGQSTPTQETPTLHGADGPRLFQGQPNLNPRNPNPTWRRWPSLVPCSNKPQP